MVRTLVFLICMQCSILGSSQYFVEMHSVYDDAFREWEVIVEQDSTEFEGSLTVTWALSNDFSSWQYDIGDHFGEIKQPFKNNPRLWQLQSEGKVVTIQQVWMGDPTQWKISFQGNSFTMISADRRILDEWYVEERKLGELVLFTENRGDPRDWIISDYMIDDVTFEERMAAIFIALYTSTPRS